MNLEAFKTNCFKAHLKKSAVLVEISKYLVKFEIHTHYVIGRRETWVLCSRAYPSTQALKRTKDDDIPNFEESKTPHQQFIQPTIKMDKAHRLYAQSQKQRMP
ncbi:hypothetical protein N7451_007521 [Penicillium sp. IBT 35674x]|nr:hypothetical protein N7451_007521 [Penicillium sp. IBT 35674x]